MKDKIEQGLYAAVGATMAVIEGLTDSAQELMNEMVERGKTAPEDGRRYVSELRARAQTESELIRERFVSAVRRQAQAADLMTVEDLERLTLRIDELDTRVALLEAKNAEREAVI